MTIKVRSRVLDKQIIKDVEFDLDYYLDSINERIKNAAEKSLKSKGRRGCTTDEVETIIRKHFNGLLHELVTSAAADLAFGKLNGSETNGERKLSTTQPSIVAKKALSRAKEILSSYSKSVGDKTTKDIEKNAIEIGINSEQIGAAKDFLKSSIQLFQKKKKANDTF